jgi:dienelactone hydrolase
MKSFSQFFAVVLYFFCVPEVTAQTLSPAPAINPSLGWSWSKTDFPSIDKEKTPLFLHYKLQKSTDSPSVLIGHDNGGINKNELAYADFLYAQGFSVFIVDRITSRRRTARPLESFLVSDTFAAVNFIKSQFQQRINPNQLSYVSFSGDGGFGGLMAIEPKARNRFNSATPDSFKLHKVVAFYPHCLRMKGMNPDTPTLVIGAELDGSNPLVCEKVYAGFPLVVVEIYQGAFHGFDQSGLKQKTWINKPVIMPGTCEWTIDLDIPRDENGFQYFMLFTPAGSPQGSSEFGRYNATCTTHQLGYYSEYREDLTRDAFQKSLVFLTHKTPP